VRKTKKLLFIAMSGQGEQQQQQREPPPPPQQQQRQPPPPPRGEFQQGIARFLRREPETQKQKEERQLQEKQEFAAEVERQRQDR